MEKSSSKKPTVLYDAKAPFVISKGRPAQVVPINHASELVSNTTTVLTSNVLKYESLSGIFETENTIYIPRWEV